MDWIGDEPPEDLAHPESLDTLGILEGLLVARERLRETSNELENRGELEAATALDAAVVALDKPLKDVERLEDRDP